MKCQFMLVLFSLTFPLYTNTAYDESALYARKYDTKRRACTCTLHGTTSHRNVVTESLDHNIL